MRRVALTTLILLLACSYAAAHTEFGGSDSGGRVPRVGKGPALTGDLSDPLWRKGGLRTIINKYDGSGRAIQQTEACFVYDSECLYIGVRCNEPELSALTAKVKDRDGLVWMDDSIEILIDTANAHHACYHFIVNSIGTLYDERCLADERTDRAWNSNAGVKTGRVEGAWTVEMAIPFRDLGVIPTPGLVWGMNICRSRFVGEPELTAWSYTPDGFIQPTSFEHLFFEAENHRIPSGILLLSWGNLDRDTTLGGENVLRCKAWSMDKPVDLELVFTSKVDGKININERRKVSLQQNGTADVEVPYSPAGSPNEMFDLTVTSGKAVVFHATHPSTAMPPKPRVWQITDPLFKELLSKNPPGLQKDGSIYWFHSGNASELRPFAKEYGLRYSLDEAFKELADNKLMPIVMTAQLTNPEWTQMADKYGVKALLEPDYRPARDKGVPQIDGLPYILDPRSREVYFANLRDTIASSRTRIWGIYTYDELSEKAAQQGVEFFSTMKDTYSYISEVDAEVKAQFGYGKYGIPESPTDENPFRWIAYHKWVNSKLLDWQKVVYETVRKLAPEIKVISMDPVAGHKPYDLDRISPWVDIVTHQLYPSANPNRQEFGFVTKFVADLTGKPVWPCAHVENYAYATTAEETRELMSQVMRNGGKGFHLYIPDVRGGGATSGDTQLTKYGSPARYRAITEILKTTRSMNEVAMPTADCAIMYSEDHYQSFPAKNYVYPNEPEYAYTFLGPVTGTWFDIINDNTVADGKDLSRYKAIVVPAARYERRSVVEKLLKYVQDGGMLVLGGPDSFLCAPDGSSLEDLRKKMIPSVVKPEGCDSRCGTYVDFGIAKGKSFTYFRNPFTEANVGDEKVKSEFKALVDHLGLETNRDIWRFKFPEFKTVYQPDPTGKCLTGNYIKWHQERPLDINNLTVYGGYTYTVAPDAIPENKNNHWSSFPRMRLLDRVNAPQIKKADLKPEDFVVSWKTEQRMSVTFDFHDPYPISRVHLWYSDQLPALTVEGSADNKTWVHLADNPKQATTKDVLDLQLPCTGTIRYVRLSFGPRDPGQIMTLAECEIWTP